MPRSVNSVASRARRKKVLSRAKGFWGTKKSNISSAKNAVDKALGYAYVGRKQKKRDYRSLWIIRINAAAHEHGMSYSRFMAALKKNNIDINRKVLADLAMNEPNAFKAIIDKVK
ncbi:MAG TPA: 50S ribosomal protein L20 [Bacteroidetes bacterium]|nr:50S ribosomal protein L20 [Bacteroidota bacterium]